MDDEKKDLNPADETREQCTQEPTQEETPVEEEAPAEEAPAAAQEPDPVPTPAPEAAPASVMDKLKAAVKKFAKKPALIAAAAAVVIILVIVIAAAAGSSPLGLVEKGVNNSIQALEKNDLFSRVSTAAQGGSLEVRCDLEGITGYPVDGFASAKLYLNSKSKAALVAGVEMDDETMFDASVFLSKDSVAMASETLLGDEAYGISLKKLAKNFEDSVFGPDGAFSLGIELPEDMGSVSDDAAELAEDLEKVADGLLRKLGKSVNKHAEISKESKAIKFNGTEVKTTAVTVSIDHESAAEILGDMLDYLRSDKTLKNCLYDYADYCASILSEAGIVGDEDPAEVIDELYETLDEITQEDLDDLEKALKRAGLELEITFNITKSGKQLVKVKCSAELYGEKADFTVQAGPSWDELEEITIRVNDGDTISKFSYTVKEDSKEEYSATLKVQEDSRVLLDGEFTWNRKKGDFYLELTDRWDDTMGAEGTIEATSKKLEIVIDSVFEYGGKTDLGLSVILTNSDKMPSMPSYTEILTMDEDEVEELIYDLQSILYRLGMFY